MPLPGVMKNLTLQQRIEKVLQEVVEKQYGITLPMVVEPPPKPEWGDYSVPVGFKLASYLRRPPHDIVRELAPVVEEALADWVAQVDPVQGYLNLHVRTEYLQDLIRIAATQENALLPQLKTEDRVLVEYVSANPTGPLNVANARAASVGDSLVRVLRALGIQADSEYYVNDGGGQIRALEHSLEYVLGERETLPEDGYRGAYLQTYAHQVRHLPRGKRGRAVAQMILKDQMKDLWEFGVSFDTIVHESFFHAPDPEDPKIGIYHKYTQAVLEAFDRHQMSFVEDGALFLKTDAYGDEKPRVLVRSNGEPTYFLYDLAYHLYKFDRGYTHLVNLWGPDHLGHVQRMKIALDMLGEALGDPRVRGDRLTVLIVQQVHLIREGKRVAMSKRKGEYYTLQDLLKEVKKDTARFFFLLRSTSSPLDFDLSLAQQLSKENPVYYVQYVHARIASLLSYGAEHGLSPDQADPRALTRPEERQLMREILYFPDTLLGVARKLEPHRIPHYLLRLAEMFHAYYQKVRIVGEDPDVSSARLLLAQSVKQVVAKGLDFIGVSAPNRM